jgi:hypothetical protein
MPLRQLLPCPHRVTLVGNATTTAVSTTDEPAGGHGAGTREPAPFRLRIPPRDSLTWWRSRREDLLVILQAGDLPPLASSSLTPFSGTMPRPYRP